VGFWSRITGADRRAAEKQARADEIAGRAVRSYRDKYLSGGPSAYNSNAGYYTGSRSGGSKWPYGLSSIYGGGVFIDHYKMRQNARDAFQDSLDARAIIERMADVVVDKGLMLEPTPNPAVLGITQEQAEEWAEAIEHRFHAWARDKRQHRSETLTFYQAQRLYEIFQQRDNDQFVRLYYSGRSDLQSSLQFEFLDPNQIRGDAFTSSFSISRQGDGIMRNADGTERAYKIWLYEDKPDGQGGYVSREIPRIGPRSKKIFMLHGFNPEYAGQGRGYSRIGFALQELENITDFSLSTIKKAINQSNLVFAVTNDQQDPSNPLEGITDFNTSAAGVSSLSSEATQVIDNLAGPNVTHLPEASLDTPGSVAMVNLEQGDKPTMLQNSTPAESFRDFIEAFSGRLAAAAGVPIEVVLMKFSNNYSASRATLVMFWRIAQIWRDEMAADFLDPVYEMWLSEEIAAGRISAPGWSDPRLRAAWLSCTWIGTPMPNIDPVKEAKASKDYLEMGATTQNRVSRNLNGSRADANIEKNRNLFPLTPVPPWSKGAVSPTESGNMEDEDDG
jgi:lambda family phage portal protein